MPCERVVSYAKSAWADAQGSQSAVARCSVVKRVATINQHAEEHIHPIMAEFGLSLPIPITIISGNLFAEGIPRLKPIDFLHYMSETGNLYRLLGGTSLDKSAAKFTKFWGNFQKIHPDFELFSADTPKEVQWSDCIPIYCHADGGRGFKKSEYMVFNWSSALGNGTGRANRKDPDIRRFRKPSSKMQVNLLGHSYATHFLWGTLSQKLHKDNEDCFQEMLLQFGADLRECFDTGIVVNGRRLRLVCLGMKGDLKLQARAGKMTRWYSTTRKGPINEKNTKQTKGLCCWLCPAGDVKYPFEELHTEEPAWKKAMETFTEPPWNTDDEPPIVSFCHRYLDRPGRFFLPDLFHIYLAGFGQDFAGSCLVYMLPVTFKSPLGDGVEAQLDTLNRSFKLWRKMFKVYTHTGSFNRNLLGFPDATKVFPTGTWSKASDTSKIITFIQYIAELFLEDNGAASDKILHYIHVASTAIGVCMKTLYEADLWIDSWFPIIFQNLGLAFSMGGQSLTPPNVYHLQLDMVVACNSK